MYAVTDFNFTDIEKKLLDMAEKYMSYNLTKTGFTTYTWINDSGNICHSETLPFNQQKYTFKRLRPNKILACDFVGGTRKKGYQVRVTLKVISELGDQSGIHEVLDLPDCYCLIGLEYKPRTKRFEVFLAKQSLHPTFD